MWNIENEGFVRTFQLDNLEEMNSINPVAIEQLIDNLDEAAGDDSVRVLILTGKQHLFSSGMNVKCFMDHQDPVNKHMFEVLVPSMFATLIDFPKPIISAVNGMAVGFGVTVCGLTDMVLMAEDARLKCPFASLGVVPEAASTYSFPRLLGTQHAIWALLCDEWIDSAKAKDMGFAMEVIADGDLMSEAMRKAQTLAQFPTVSLVETKRLIVDPHRAQLQQANLDEMKVFQQMLEHPACQEGLSAFREKRKPDYSQF